jgi:hypothetical protein
MRMIIFYFERTSALKIWKPQSGMLSACCSKATRHSDQPSAIEIWQEKVRFVPILALGKRITMLPMTECVPTGGSPTTSVDAAIYRCPSPRGSAPLPDRRLSSGRSTYW